MLLSNVVSKINCHDRICNIQMNSFAAPRCGSSASWRSPSC